jgi:hypothetical protein
MICPPPWADDSFTADRALLSARHHAGELTCAQVREMFLELLEEYADLVAWRSQPSGNLRSTIANEMRKFERMLSD